jgi:hypothetical protein
MSKEYVPTTIKVVNDFSDDEIDEFLKLIQQSEYRQSIEAAEWEFEREDLDELRGAGNHYFELVGEMPNGENEAIEEYLLEKQIPFVRWSDSSTSFSSELSIFDGVRKNVIPSNKEQEALVNMSVLREILDELEESEDSDRTVIGLLGLVNWHWIETDISKFFRYGMENAIPLKPNQDDNVIDVEIEEHNDGDSDASGS